MPNEARAIDVLKQLKTGDPMPAVSPDQLFQEAILELDTRLTKIETSISRIAKHLRRQPTGLRP